MDHLSPAFSFLMFIRQKMEQGESLKSALKLYSHQSASSKWKSQVLQWVREFELSEFKADGLNPYHRALKFALYRGWKGEPILILLKQLEEEFFSKSQHDIEVFSQKLSVWGLIPLLFMMFPALVLLLLGPFLSALNL